MKREVTINKWDRDGVFVVVTEGKMQGPIAIETEGEDSSHAACVRRINQIPWNLRACICRLVPVSGNELLIADMQRMQRAQEDEA